jgi:YesN/AraC family two-component response regulator
MKRNFFTTLQFFLGFKHASRGNARKQEPRATDLLRNKLDTFMLQQKPYLREHYTLKDLSEDMEVPLHQLSAFLNKQVGMNFNDFLNRFRIKHCEELIRNEVPGKVNLKELAYKCGFHNRNTFSNAFKKFTGKTPSDYVRASERSQG